MLGSTVDTSSSSLRTVEVPLPVHRQSGGYCFYVTETGTHSVKLCNVVDNPVMAQRTFPLVPCSRPERFPSCSPLTRCSMSFLCKSSRFSGAGREKFGRDPTVGAIEPGQGRSHARCVQRQMPGWFRRWKTVQVLQLQYVLKVFDAPVVQVQLFWLWTLL